MWVHQTIKYLESLDFLKKRNFYDFLKNRNYGRHIDYAQTPRFLASGHGQHGWPRSFFRVRQVLMGPKIIH